MSLVEYHDPDGLFPLISTQLYDHLPLRNLHWSPPNRPVRSIPSLNVDFAPRSRVLRSSVVSGPSPHKDNVGPAASRRHQLPGLRQTAYLKLFLLRCDDKDAYKTLKRDVLRTWANEIGLPSNTGRNAGKQENHDAFEWLILHIVLPDTVAATEPRWTRDSESDLDLPKEKSSGGTRWPGKRPRSILERLRKDFNTHTKSAPDKVAQIRLRKDEIPLDVAPELPPPVAANYTESLKDRENAWTDLIAKFKFLILKSFNLRVAQYEDDIHEKELQRNLPGWNYCTFFVLKEGLAKIFETVGLIDEALRGYEELSVGLDSIIQDRSSERSSSQSTSFLDYTQEFAEFMSIIEQGNHGTHGNDVTKLALQRPLDPERKNYRELIVANQVSIFDFKCYICSRKIALMVRKADQSPAKGVVQDSTKSHSNDTEHERFSRDFGDPPTLAKVCQFATESIPYLARLLRYDLFQGVTMTQQSQDRQNIDIVVAAWTYAAAKQAFAFTQSKHFPESRLALEFGSKPNMSRPEKRSDRRSGLLIAGAGQSSSPGKVAQNSDNGTSSAILKNTALLKAAAFRADLCLTQRRILEKVLKWRNWHLQRSVELDEDAEESDLVQARRKDEGTDPVYETPAASILETLQHSALYQTSSSVETLKREYESLSDCAAWSFSLAGRERSSEQLIADLAILKFNDNDFSAAVSYLGPLVSSFSHRKWNYIEAAMLKMHAVSLKKLNRKDDYVRTVLSLLVKYAETSKHTRELQTPQGFSSVMRHRSWLDDSLIDVSSMFQEVVNYSRQLPYDLEMNLKSFFSLESVDHHTRLIDGRDGFKLGVVLKSLLEEDVTGAKISVCLHGTEHHSGVEIWLYSKHDCLIRGSSMRFELESNVSTLGVFLVGKLLIQIGRIKFLHEALERPQAPSPFSLLTSEPETYFESVKCQSVLCYSRADSFHVDIRAVKAMRIAKAKILEFEVSAGQNSVRHSQISVKSETAGLRIHTANITSPQKYTVFSGSSPGILESQELPPFTKTKFYVPYDIGHNFSSLKVRLDVSYDTENGTFLLLKRLEIDVGIPLEVNVQDLFRETSLFSKFFLASVSMSPLQILDVHLESNQYFNVLVGNDASSSMIIHPSEPGCTSFKLLRTSDTAPTDSDNSRTLPFSVVYRSMSEIILSRTSNALKAAFDETPDRQFGGLLAPALLENLTPFLQADVLENSVLTESFQLPSFQSLNWDPILAVLPRDKVHSIREWLQNWHESHPTIDLSLDSEDPNTRTLQIDFEIPAIDFLHTVSITICNEDTFAHLPSGEPMVTTGTALSCDLSIRYTTRWSLQPDGVAESKPFTCTINADPSLWLICGPTRFAFDSKPGETNHFQLTLVPLCSGSAPLPTVDVRPFEKSHDPQSRSIASPNSGPGSDAAILSPKALQTGPLSPVGLGISPNTGISPRSQTELQNPLTTCETECTTAGQGVMVVDGVESVVVGIGAEVNGDGEGGRRDTVEILHTRRWDDMSSLQ